MTPRVEVGSRGWVLGVRALLLHPAGSGKSCSPVKSNRSFKIPLLKMCSWDFSANPTE